MAKRVKFVEIHVYEKMVPLVSGYLQAYACADMELRKTYRFNYYATTAQTTVEKIVQELTQQNSDIYAFS